MGRKKPEESDRCKGQKHRDRAATRSRELSASASEIGPHPKRNEKLWKKYRFDLFGYLQDCFPNSTGLSPLSADHRTLAERTQETILSGGIDLFVVYRGFAKSTITENAATWAAGYGHCPFFVPVGATEEMARLALASVQFEFETNDMLMELFPEVCHPARALEGVVQRARKQTMNGELTRIEWSTRRCVLPTVKGFPGSGAIIWPKGILSNLHGLRFKRPDGTQARPAFIMGDDLQTRESAASAPQSQKRLSIFSRSILRLGGHKRKLAVTVNATVMEPDDMIDQMSDPKKFPGVRTMKVPMLRSLSMVHETEWLGKYADILTTYTPDDKEDRARAQREATAYYKKRRKIMDEGAVASWPTCYDEENEISAIQHAYNILILEGEDCFLAECQNTPRRDVGDLEILKPEAICHKQSDYPRLQVPPGCTLIAAHIDCHDQIFYWEAWAFEPNFTSFKIDEGTFPDQKRKYFAHRSIGRKLKQLFPKMDLEAAIAAGLDALLHGHEPSDWPGLAIKQWIRADGVPMTVGSGLVDANGVHRDVIVKVVSRSPFSQIWRPAFGKGIGAKNAPISAWPQTREQRIVGPEFIYTKPIPSEVPGILFDTNYWKTRFHRALAQPKGNQGAAHLWKTTNPTDHRLAADHYVSEKAVEVTVGSRTVNEFSLKANADNHKLDNAVGCQVAAARGGITNVKRPTVRPRPSRKKVTYL